MKRKLSGMILVTLMMFVLSGCRMYVDYTANGDGTVTTASRVAYTQEEYDSLDSSERAALTLTTLEDGKQYYVTATETTTSTSASLAEEGMVLTTDIFYFEVGSSEEYVAAGLTEDDMYVQMTVNLGSDIVDANADKSVDGNAAVFSFPNNENTVWYAYTQAGKEKIAADKTAPKMVGAKNNKYYKKVPENIKFTDNIAVKEVKLNGKKVVAVTTMVATEDSYTTTTAWATPEGKDVYKSGKNVFQVTDLSGNTSTFTIYIDKKAPTVKGVKNNKTYNKKAVIYVKDNLKLAKVTINGKTQRMTKKQLVKKGKYKGYYKYTVKKKGTNRIVVKDAAGNKKTLKIKIKK